MEDLYKIPVRLELKLDRFFNSEKILGFLLHPSTPQCLWEVV